MRINREELVFGDYHGFDLQPEIRAAAEAKRKQLSAVGRRMAYRKPPEARFATTGTSKLSLGEIVERIRAQTPSGPEAEVPRISREIAANAELAAKFFKDAPPDKAGDFDPDYEL